jgi:hypothetical protein
MFEYATPRGEATSDGYTRPSGTTPKSVTISIFQLVCRSIVTIVSALLHGTLRLGDAPFDLGK